jgi:outer membrane protein assembly factor BamD (BamD/ComL family)
MGEGSYFNFDLIVERMGEKYRARVFDSPAGQASIEFELPFSALELENFVLRMGRPRAGVRRLDSSEMEAVKQCGERLFRAVFTDDVYASFLRSRDTALEEEKGLRVRLRIDVPEFHDYPWEFLYNAHLNQFLALSKDTPVVRYLELPYPVQPLTVQPPLKILVMISSPDGFPKLNVEEEWRRLSNALSPLLRRDLVTLERLKNPTLSALQQRLRRGEYHIFHFVGHGKFSEHKQDGMLLLEEVNGSGRPVSGQYLGTVLHDHRSLRLVVLNACEGARTSREDPYAGVAQTLVLQGIPAVIAMQFEIIETAAITFAQEFYGSVADGFPVDAAVSEARKAIFATGNDVEWGTPVLYMRTPQGVIFEIPEALRVRGTATDESTTYVDRELEQRLEGLYTEGLAAFWVEDWDKACDRFKKILAERPDHVAAADKMAEAKRQQRLASLYARATEAQSTENWPVAQKTLEELLKYSPGYKDASTTLKLVKKQKRLAELYAEAKQLYSAEKWQAVAKVFAQIKSLDPEYPDPEAILPTAEKELAELKRLAKLNELYSHAVHAIDAGQWEEAQSMLRQVQGMEPGFLETEKLLSKVESEIRKSIEEQKRQDQINTLYEQAHGLLRSKKWRQALDKIEEIGKLDEQFEDPEKIAERAQKEIAREEQEAERQNELAAMYAEAVRMVREEKNQEALEKWQEIRDIDSKFPDRQRVQRTAKKGLAVQSKPVPEKHRISVPKQLWIGLGGIITLAIIILVLNFSGKNDEEPASSVIVVPTVDWGGDAVIHTPQKTNTPKPPTATQAASSYADVTLYDDFEGNTFDGQYDTALWEWQSDDANANIFQSNGVLEINSSGYNKGADLGITKFSGEVMNTPLFVEASVRLEPNQNGGIGIYYEISRNGNGGYCHIWAMNQTQEMYCFHSFGQEEDRTEDINITQGTWHTLRIEFVPGPPLEITYIIDGLMVGTYSISTLEQVEPEVNFHIGSGCYGGGCVDKNPRTLTGYIDYVRIGAIRDDPTVYDSFNDSIYDGRFNPTLWWYDPDAHSLKTESIQQDGLLIITQSGIDETSFLTLKKYWGKSIPSNTYFEASFKIEMSSDGAINLSLLEDGSCGLNTKSDWAEAYCGDSINYRGVRVAHGSWNTFRIEIDVDKNVIRFYVNGVQFGENQFSNSLKSKILYPCIGIWSGTNRVENTRPVVAYVDNVRIAPLK